jgi:hypothetical protein
MVGQVDVQRIDSTRLKKRFAAKVTELFLHFILLRESGGAGSTRIMRRSA